MTQRRECRPSQVSARWRRATAAQGREVKVKPRSYCEVRSRQGARSF